MRYWVRDGKDARGPYTLEELAAQETPDSALVCPENRPKNRRENWLPLRKAKAPPRFHTRVGSKVRGPYTAEELGRLHGFSPDSLLCPEGRNFRSRWNWAPARSFPGLRPAQARPEAERPAAPSPGRTAALGDFAQRWGGAAGRWRNPSITTLAAVVGSLMAGVLLWMNFSYLPKVRQTYQRVHTGMSLVVIAGLQERYRKETGRYAPDFDTLVRTAGPWLPEIMSDNLDLETLMVKGATDHFELEANALDDRRTLYHFKAFAPASSAAASGQAP